MANRRARGKVYPGKKKASAAKNDNTATLTGARQRVKTLSSQDATAVGRPGFGGSIPGPVDGKSGVKILSQKDPSKGITQDGARKITSSNVDLVGTQEPTILSAAGVQPALGAGRKTISSGQPSGGPKSLPKKR
jgi:hypothetical protein